jgi:hypothetical protein
VVEADARDEFVKKWSPRNAAGVEGIHATAETVMQSQGLLPLSSPMGVSGRVRFAGGILSLLLDSICGRSFHGNEQQLHSDISTRRNSPSLGSKGVKKCMRRTLKRINPDHSLFRSTTNLSISSTSTPSVNPFIPP